MRAHSKRYPPTGSKHKKLSQVAQTILARESSIEVDFTPAEELTQPKKKVARFAPNPGSFTVPLIEGSMSYGPFLYLVSISYILPS
jgi:hypothetical protein